ncbi:hypothetical protein [Streptomyces cinereoruber]|uniref:hypothetical protein n=1 Tax=Streptomyces cinereoruber TaxID=67260 RepID=UPI003C2AE5AB
MKIIIRRVAACRDSGAEGLSRHAAPRLHEGVQVGSAADVAEFAALAQLGVEVFRPITGRNPLEDPMGLDIIVPCTDRTGLAGYPHG